MSRIPQPTLTPQARAQAIEEARLAGELGFPRVPDTALFPDGLDPGNTTTLRVIDEFLAGQLQRCKP